MIAYKREEMTTTPQQTADQTILEAKDIEDIAYEIRRKRNKNQPANKHTHTYTHAAANQLNGCKKATSTVQ